MDHKEYAALRNSEEALRLRFNIGKNVALFPMWLHPHFERWQNYWAAENDCYFKAVPGKTAREIHGRIDSDGYRQITANNGTLLELAHRIQFRLFSGSDIPDGFVVHHRNGRRLDNSVLNLEAMQADDHRRLPRQQYRRLTEEEIAIAVALAETGMKVAQIAKTMDMTHRRVADLLRQNGITIAARSSEIAFSAKSDQREGPEERPL